MSELEIKGKKKYLSYLKKHLAEEHPKTARHMELEHEKRKKIHKKYRRIEELWTY